MRSIVASLLAIFLVVADGSQDAVKKDMAALDGQWSMVSAEANGQAMGPAMVKTAKRVSKNGETTVTVSGMTYLKATYKVDPAKTPKAIDYAMTEGATKGKTQLGIYEIDGDTVKFCFAAPGRDRPTKFEAKEGSENTLSVWKRVKTKGK